MSPELHVETCFVLNDDRRIVSTREPNGQPGPLFTVIRGSSSCAWAVRADVSRSIALELEAIASDEPPTADFRSAPVHTHRYLNLLGSTLGLSHTAGPAFSFPQSFVASSEPIRIEDELMLKHNFRGWVPGEIEAGCGPVVGIVRDGHPVSVCFSARRTDFAAEAGVETAERYRRSGYGAEATTAWAIAVRSTGRVPLYSTSWDNQPSLGVARRLGLVCYAKRA
jgi:hypothetical protein